MNESEIHSRLERVFQRVFKNEDLRIHAQMTAEDYEPWDSLNHIDLLIAIETEFGVRFSNAEIAGFKNVGDLARLVASKTS